MIDYNEFKDTLTEMSERSTAFQLVKLEMEKRGHWKAKKRGTKKPLRNLAGADTHLAKRLQVTWLPYKDSDDFSEGL